MENLYCAHSIKMKFFSYFQNIKRFPVHPLYDIIFTP